VYAASNTPILAGGRIENFAPVFCCASKGLIEVSFSLDLRKIAVKVPLPSPALP